MACGLFGGVVIARMLSAALIELSPLDPVAYLSVALLIGVSLMAILIPSRRAAKVIRLRR